MPAFKIRAQWWGPDGAQVGVADDTAEAEDACNVLMAALPDSSPAGVYTNAEIRIEPLPHPHKPKIED